MPWGVVAGAVIGAVGSVTAANTAADASQAATDAQKSTADKQQQLAQDQWDFQKNTYLPKAMANADTQIANSTAITQDQLANSKYQMDLSKTQNTQAQKSYAYQDQYDKLADDYSSGKVGNTQANEANADVEQAYTNATGSLQRSQSRMGINPGSGAAAAAAGDMYTNKMLAGAGAQTNARVAARNKAESMVAIAAGAGNAGFGTGAASGALANGAINGASITNANSGAGLNGVAATYGTGLNTASNIGTAGANTWNSAVNNANNTASAYAGAANGIGRAIGSYNFGSSSNGSSTGYGMPTSYNTSTGTTYAPSQNYGDGMYGPS